MDIKETLYNEFYSYVKESLESTLKETIEDITSNSNFKYGTDKDKLRVLEYFKEDYAGNGHFNYLKVKGVKYNQGKFEIVKTEFDEVIKICGVNLENTEFGIFQNKNDKEKPFAYKSFVQANSIFTYCLELQIIREFEQAIEGKISNSKLPKEMPSSENFTPNLTIFKNKESHMFFDFLYNDWLKKEKKCRPQLSYIVSVMRKDKSELSITCPSLKDFAYFWNNTYSHPFRLTFKNSKLNLSDEPSAKYQTAFDNRKEYFEREIMHSN